MMYQGEQCVVCKHRILNVKDFPCCEAFPKGIPNKLLQDIVEHDHKLTGQTGDYVFKEEAK